MPKACGKDLDNLRDSPRRQHDAHRSKTVGQQDERYHSRLPSISGRSIDRRMRPVAIIPMLT